jgi:hypothetical protein
MSVGQMGKREIKERMSIAQAIISHYTEYRLNAGR